MPYPKIGSETFDDFEWIRLVFKPQYGITKPVVVFRPDRTKFFCELRDVDAVVQLNSDPIVDLIELPFADPKNYPRFFVR